MKVYVDELPKSCWECPMLANKESGEGEPYCVLTDIYLGNHKSCPLQSLADYTKQVRKEVCEEIKEKCERTYTISPSTNKPQKEVLIILAEILDQIQRGE